MSWQTSAAGFGSLRRAFGATKYLNVFKPRVRQNLDTMFLEIIDKLTRQTFVIQTLGHNSPVSEIRFTIDKAGCGKGKLLMNRLFDYRPSPFSEVRVKLAGQTKPVWSGFIQIADDQSTQKEKYSYDLFGFRKEFEKLPVNKIFKSTSVDGYVNTFRDVVRWIIQKRLTNRTNNTNDDILVNDTSQINAVPTTQFTINNEDNTEAGWNLKDMSVLECLKQIAKITSTYWFVSPDKVLNFRSLSDTNIEKVFFESFKAKSSEVKTVESKVVNEWLVVGQKASNVPDLKVYSTASDQDSIDRFGLKSEKFETKSFISESMGDIIAAALVSQTKEPPKSVKIKGYPLDSYQDIIQNGVYRYVGAYKENELKVTSFEDVSEYDLIQGGIIETDTGYPRTKSLFGEKSLRLDSGTNIIEFSKLKNKRVKNLKFFIKAVSADVNFRLGMRSISGIDSSGKKTRSSRWRIGSGTGVLGSAVFGGYHLARLETIENVGGGRATSSWNVYQFNVDVEIKQVILITDGSIYIDSISSLVLDNKVVDAPLRRVNYKIKPNNYVADIELGEDVDMIENQLARLVDGARQANIQNRT